MSGIVGIFDRTGKPVGAKQLQLMTRFLAFRGPDRSDTFVAGEVGFGHTLLRTCTGASDEERQPFQLGDLWITADARIDCRAELVKELIEAGAGTVEGHASDAKLILHAYAAWGAACVSHLRGDFSFGVWDSSAKTLFCARDHLGIKPFYYADLGGIFLFSNTLDCLRQHPLVTNALNDAAIGDFLLFGLNYNKATTTFRDIQRLPPAHWLAVTGDSVKTYCYWQLPTEDCIRYARAHEYVDRFDALLNSAVSDRLPSDNAGILLSGGLDSGVVAASAREISTKRGGKPNLRGYTVGYDSLIEDNERYYAAKTASRLDIPHKYLSLDHVELFEKWEDAKVRLPEPTDDPLSAGGFQEFEMIAADCRVVLSGEGADNLMYFQMWPHIKELQRAGDLRRLLTDSAWFLWVRPIPWRGVAQRIRSLFARASGNAGIPIWIAPEFAKRARLEERWAECNQLIFPSGRHPVRPKAHASMLLPQWTNLFETNDPGATHSTLEVRYPFLDLRLVAYLLAIPAFPWAYKKTLIRKLSTGKLPQEVLLRPKTPLTADPAVAKFKLSATDCMKGMKLQGPVCEFVDPARLRNFRDTIRNEDFRPFCLSLWLKGVS